MSTPVPIRNRLAVLDALRRGPTLADAAKTVQLSVNEMRYFAYSQRLHMAYLRLERGTALYTHPGFKDLSGKPIYNGSAVVVKRERNSVRGNARWRIRLTACGHELVREAIQLRSDEKKKVVPKCPACKVEARSA